MPHIKVVFLWPYARPRGVHPAYARAYAYAYHSCICIPPTQVNAISNQGEKRIKNRGFLSTEFFILLGPPLPTKGVAKSHPIATFYQNIDRILELVKSV